MYFSRERPLLSILLGTYNRKEALVDSLCSIHESIAGELTYEIVICDGGSTDGTRELLARDEAVVLLGKRSLDGAVDAFNLAYQASRGEYILTLNDDCKVLGSIPDWIEMLKECGDRGQLALRFDHEGRGSYLNEVFGKAKRRSTYANFSLTHRKLTELVVYIQGGYWSPAYYTYGGDVEFSMWVWRLGFEVFGSGTENEVLNLPARDSLREWNNNKALEEHHRIYARWRPEYLDSAGPLPKVEPDVLERYEAVRCGLEGRDG